jgi:hypothetical protein
MMKATAGWSRALFLLLGLGGAPAIAQDSGAVLAGRVVDARSGQALGDVLVRVEGQPVFVETAADGAFRLAVAGGTHTVVAALVGFAEHRSQHTVAPGETRELVIELSEGAGQFEERVTVTGELRGDAAAAPGASTLHGRDLQALRGVMLDDPLRAVQALPAATSTDDFYSEFAVRGSPFRALGLAVDGIPSPYLIHTIHGVTDGGSIAMVNSEALGSVSLLPGGYPQRTGRRYGAHVDLTTRDGSRESVRARAGLSGTSAGLLVEGPMANKRGSWLVSARRSYLDYLLRRIDPDENFGFGFSDGLAKATLDLNSRHQLQVTAVAGRSLFDEAAEDLGDNDEAEARSRAWLTSLGWRYTPSARLSIWQRVYATGHGFDNVNASDAPLDRGHDRVAAWRADITVALRDGWIAELGGDLQYLTAAQFRQRSFDNAPSASVLEDYRASSRSASFYAQTTARGARWAVTPGVRTDYLRATGRTTVSPWMTGELRLPADIRLKAGAGQYRQPPSLSYLNGLGGNADLEDERAIHADVTLARSWGGSLTSQLTAYTREEDDVLRAFDAEPRLLPDGAIALGRGDAKWENRLRGRARGVEALLRRDAPSGVTGWLAYAYSEHRYEDLAAGERFWSDHDQRHTVSAYVNSRLSNRTSLGAKVRYGSNYPITGYVGEARNSDTQPPLLGGMRPIFLSVTNQRNGLRLPPYLRVDVRADRVATVAGRRVTFFVEVANALNRSNERNVPYSVQRSGRIGGATDSMLPIVPSAGFVVEF